MIFSGTLAAHRPVRLQADLGIGRAPNLAIRIESGDPSQMMFRAVIDDSHRLSGAATDYIDRDSRI